MKVEANSEIANANKRCDEINKIIRKLYEDKHSLYSFGINVGNALIAKECLQK